MSRRAPATQADMQRAMKAAVASGLTVQECEITPQKVRLIFVRSDAVDVPHEDANTPKPKEWPRKP